MGCSIHISERNCSQCWNVFAPTSIWLVLFVVLSLLPTATSFSIQRANSDLTRETSLFSILDGDEQNDNIDLSNFNPLSYKTSKKRDSTYSTTISLRKARMQELTSELLNAIGDNNETERILLEYQDFLLEPLEDLEAVLEPDSIYAPQMSRKERYGAYRSSMEERLEASKNPQVRSILKSMRDFVVSCEERQSAGE